MFVAGEFDFAYNNLKKADFSSLFMTYMSNVRFAFNKFLSFSFLMLFFEFV